MTFWNHNKAVANASFRNEVAVKAIECDAVGPNYIYMQLYLMYSCYIPAFHFPTFRTLRSRQGPPIWRHHSCGAMLAWSQLSSSWNLNVLVVASGPLSRWTSKYLEPSQGLDIYNHLVGNGWLYVVIKSSKIFFLIPGIQPKILIRNSERYKYIPDSRVSNKSHSKPRAWKVRETTVKNPWKDSEKPVKTNQKLEHGNHIILFRILRIDLRIRLGSGERSPFFDL